MEGAVKKKDDMENISSFERYIGLQFNLKIKNDKNTYKYFGITCTDDSFPIIPGTCNIM